MIFILISINFYNRIYIIKYLTVRNTLPLFFLFFLFTRITYDYILNCIRIGRNNRTGVDNSVFYFVDNVFSEICENFFDIIPCISRALKMDQI